MGLLLSVFPIQSSDLFLYLASGRIFLETGAFPKTDPFLFSIPDYPWIVLPKWGSHALFYLLYKVGTWPGLILFKAALIGAALCLPLWLSRRLSCNPEPATLFALWAAFAGANRFILRASLFSDLATAGLVAILLTRPGPLSRRRQWLPVLFLLWVNLHPGFLVGLVILGLFVVERFLKEDRASALPWLNTLGLCLLACFANPETWRGVIYPLTVYTADWAALNKNNFEWFSPLNPTLRGFLSIWLFYGLTAATGFLLWTARKTKPYFESAVFLALAYLSFSAVRFLLPAALAFSSIATILWHRSAFVSLGRALRPGIVLAIQGALLLKLLFWGYHPISGPRRPGFGVDERFQPVEAERFLKDIRLKLPLFNEHEFGAYLAWRWNGDPKVFYHGFITDGAFYRDEYMGINRSLQDFERIVRKHDIGAFLLESIGSGLKQGPLLYRILWNHPGWEAVYRDKTAIVFLRYTPANAEAFARAKALRKIQ